MLRSAENSQQPRIAVYTGSGASHSWMWFAEILDRIGYYNVCFLNEYELAGDVLERCDVFFVSGGDTFAIADAMSDRAGVLHSFIHSGGTYIGTCAGAYLLMKSSLSPLDRFNFANVRIANLSKNLPPSFRKREKFCTIYGCRYVFHPVREEVTVRMNNGQRELIAAPLYGGPSMHPSDDAETIAVFEGFTDKTEYLTEPRIAQETLTGKTAAAAKKYGKGMIYLFGPHFEHPEYPLANAFLFNILHIAARKHASSIDASGHAQSGRKKNMFRKILGNISNARIAAHGFEQTAYRWSIGKKVYEPEKILMFIEAVWKHARFIHEKGAWQHLEMMTLEQLTDTSGELTYGIRELRSVSAEKGDGDAMAASVIEKLRVLSSRIYSLYFSIQQGAVDNGTGICDNINGKTNTTLNHAAVQNS